MPSINSRLFGEGGQLLILGLTTVPLTQLQNARNHLIGAAITACGPNCFGPTPVNGWQPPSPPAPLPLYGPESRGERSQDMSRSDPRRGNGRTASQADFSPKAHAARRNSRLVRKRAHVWDMLGANHLHTGYIPIPSAFAGRAGRVAEHESAWYCERNLLFGKRVTVEPVAKKVNNMILGRLPHRSPSPENPHVTNPTISFVL